MFKALHESLISRYAQLTTRLIDDCRPIKLIFLTYCADSLRRWSKEKKVRIQEHNEPTSQKQKASPKVWNNEPRGFNLPLNQSYWLASSWYHRSCLPRLILLPYLRLHEKYDA